MENDSSLKNWLREFAPACPLMIAGPCSAETEQQVLATAHLLSGKGVSVFRAGIWKPRTRPGGFEGVGEIGLKWLVKAKAETGLRMAVEVANATHVKLALEHDIDVLWIGARTTVNPFAVQEIADALQKTDKVILIKNPVNPDLALWIGGIERIYNSGIKNLGVIHRGFSTYEKTKYRNIPEWQIAIELQSRFPDLPMICDPSHMTGRRDLIASVSQYAMDLNYDGLMIESHIDPDSAWSDAFQQITPERLLQIMDGLIIRSTHSRDEEFHEEITRLRSKIDQTDSEILQMLGRRMEIAEKIGSLKKEKNVAILQSKRWMQVLERMKAEGELKGLSDEFILRLFRAIHEESITHQEKIING
jgi:chorismate mutase